MAALFYWGGVLEDVLGLEDTFSRPWPQILKSSKIALSSAWGQHDCLNGWNFVDRLKKKYLEIDGKKILRPFFLGKHLHLCPWSLASSITVLGLGLGFFLCPWPWPRVSCPRLHLCYFMLTLLSHLLWNAAVFREHLLLRHFCSLVVQVLDSL